MSFRATVESMSKIMDEMGITELDLERQFLFGVYRKHIHLSKQQATAVAMPSLPVSGETKAAATAAAASGYALKSPMNAHIATCTNNTQCDFTAIGNQYFFYL